VGLDAHTPEQLFDGFPASLALYDVVREAVVAIGDVSVRVTKSQVAFRRRRGFAYVWRPGQYVRNDVPVVLSIALPHELTSDRVASVVHPATDVWMHHVELRRSEQVDDELRGWLAEAFSAAG
jgi:predicted transport protein